MALFGGYTPSITSQLTMTYRTLEYQFGSGYKQVAPDGINYALENWQLTFENIPATGAAAMETWINTYGDPTMTFNTTMVLGSVAKTYRMSNAGYTKMSSGGDVYTYTFNIEQVF